MNTIIEKIKAEIERRKNNAETLLERNICIDILFFIETIESETPKDIEERWDELQTNFREINEAFEAGKKEQREQMMREAVEGVVCYGSKGSYIETDFLGEYNTDVYGNPGDKVRIIIVKE